MTWLPDDQKEPITIPKARFFVEREPYTLIVPEATGLERGTYVCRAINAYGQVDTNATVDVTSSSIIDGGKPAVFVSRPSKKSIDVIVGEDISISFRVSGIPKPRSETKLLISNIHKLILVYFSLYIYFLFFILHLPFLLLF